MLRRVALKKEQALDMRGELLAGWGLALWQLEEALSTSGKARPISGYEREPQSYHLPRLGEPSLCVPRHEPHAPLHGGQGIMVSRCVVCVCACVYVYVCVRARLISRWTRKAGYPSLTMSQPQTTAQTSGRTGRLSSARTL